MEGDTAFRNAEATLVVPVPEAASLVTEKVHPHDEMPPSLYLEAHKVPLVLDLLGGTTAYEHFDMKPLSQEIDRYVIEEVNRLGLDDTKDNYQQVLDEAIEKLKFPKGTDVYALVEKLVRHFRIQHKLYSALRDKEALMMADPMTLSAAKLKLYIDKGYGL